MKSNQIKIGGKNILRKRMIQILIILLISSLVCAAIYATETGEVSNTDSSNTFNINESNNISKFMDSISPIHHNNHHMDTLKIHI